MFVTDRIEDLIREKFGKEPLGNVFKKEKGETGFFQDLHSLLHHNNNLKPADLKRKKTLLWKSKKEYLKRLLEIRAKLRKLPEQAQHSGLHEALNLEILILLKHKKK